MKEGQKETSKASPLNRVPYPYVQYNKEEMELIIGGIHNQHTKTKLCEIAAKVILIE